MYLRAKSSDMPASSRGTQAAVSLISEYITDTNLTINRIDIILGYSQHPRICSDCISSISKPRRHYAVAAAALKTSDGTRQDPKVAALPPVTQTDLAPYTVKSGIILSRPPILTRPLSAFEKAFFFYQKRLNERLAMPFTRYFYFKKDTPADNDWKRKVVERNGSAARELGGYQAYGEFAWNDEILVGDTVSEPKSMVEALVKDAQIRGSEEEGDAVAVERDANIERPLDRLTEADKTKDMRRLDRKLARTLYLCVKREKGGWGFPAGEVIGRENLHQVCPEFPPLVVLKVELMY